MSDTLAELEELLFSCQDGDASLAQWQRVESLLTADATARAHYVRWMGLQAHLRFQQESVRFALPIEVEPSRELVSPEWRHRWWSPVVDTINRNSTVSMLVSGLFTAIILLSMALIVPEWQRPDRLIGPSRSDFVARVVHVQNAKWSAANEISASKATDLLAGQTIELESGLAEILFDSGARIILEGPVTLVLRTDSETELRSGKLVASVPPQAVGFVVDSRLLQVTDLGTEFAVEIGPDEAEVHVFVGKIKFRSYGSDSLKSTVLAAGEAVQVAGGSHGEIKRIAATASDFTRTISPQFASDIPTVKALLRYRPEIASLRRSDGPFTIGLLFEVGERPLDVTHLGAQDVTTPVSDSGGEGTDDSRTRLTYDGFYQSPVSVGLWNEDGSQLLASAEIGGFNRPVLNSWRYAHLETGPIRLEPHKRYLVGAFVGGGIEWFLDGGEGKPQADQPFVGGTEARIVENRFTPDSFGPPLKDGNGKVSRWGAANLLFTVVPDGNAALSEQEKTVDEGELEAKGDKVEENGRRH